MHQVLMHNAAQGQWLNFTAPVETVTASTCSQVLPALQRIEKRVECGSYWAAGFVTYEAAAAFDRACRVHAPSELPLLWFGIYPQPEILDHLDPTAHAAPLNWRASWGQKRFSQATAIIHEAIASGETYQVNLTFPLTTPFAGPPEDFFPAMVQGHHAHYAAYLDLGRHVICSASPELFFSRQGQQLKMKPMKGTMARGMTTEEDQRRAKQLNSSVKERAENIMILDMVRNDISRLAGPGQVKTTGLCELEKYPTVWQMTSSVEAGTSASFVEIMRALFPCASITGAPKYRTMDIIRRLEQAPRGIYTGCIGYLGPDRQAQFSVAIRTALIDRERGTASYGVGAGITWDSRPAAEYRECLAKAQILSRPMPDFALLETLLWCPQHGYFLLQEHLRRLARSADYFDIPCDLELAVEILQARGLNFGFEKKRVRLQLATDGQFHCDASLAPEPGSGRVRLRLAAQPVDPDNPFYYHKTTHRRIYEDALSGKGDCEDVILWNSAGEITETTTSNLVVDQAGTWLTPPVSSGLLAGTFRDHLLHLGKIQEGRVTLEELRTCRNIFLINSLRGWRRALLVDGL